MNKPDVMITPEISAPPTGQASNTSKPAIIILALRLTIIFSIITMAFAAHNYKLPDISLQVYIALGIFLLHTLLGHFEYLHIFNTTSTPMIGFLVDISAMTLFIYYVGGSDAQQFYIVFLIIILITASIRSVKSAFITTLIGALIYGLISTRNAPSITGIILSGQFLSRVSFLFVVATFIGYLSEEVERHRRDKITSEQAFTTEIKNLTEYLRNVFQSIPSGIVVVDNTDKITVFNKRAEEVWGIRAPDVLGRQAYNIPRLKEFYRVITDFYNQPHSKKEHADTSRAEITVDKGMNFPPVYIGIRFSILHDLAGNKTGAIGVFQDLTQIKEYEKELFRKERLAAVGQLASGMAHDFFNTLGGLKGIVELSLANPAAAPVTETLTITKRGLNRALAIVRNLLNFSRKPEPHTETVSLSEIIDESFSLINHELDKDGIEIVKKVSDTRTIVSDPNLLQQVFLNLLLNARQAILPDRGRITVEVITQWDFVTVSISDTGKGISAKDKLLIFDPFFSTKSGNAKKEGGGMGLGLYVSNEIINTLQGYIDVESAPGQGTTFTIKLPLEMK